MIEIEENKHVGDVARAVLRGNTDAGTLLGRGKHGRGRVLKADDKVMQEKGRG